MKAYTHLARLSDEIGACRMEYASSPSARNADRLRKACDDLADAIGTRYSASPGVVEPVKPDIIRRDAHAQDITLAPDPISTVPRAVRATCGHWVTIGQGERAPKHCHACRPTFTRGRKRKTI